MKESNKGFLDTIRQSIFITVIMMLVCGLIYPTLMTGLATVIFPEQAKGSLVELNGQTVAAKFVGQEFQKDYFLWSRPSAYHYNVYHESEDGTKFYNDGTEFAGLSSGSSNYAPSNPDLIARTKADIEVFIEKNPGVKKQDIPTDLLTASGSGLDPHITPASAEIQIPRIAEASGLNEQELRKIISQHTSGKLFGVFGENIVNVVEVNIEIAQAMNLSIIP